LLYNPFSHSDDTEINVKDIFIYKNYIYFIYIFVHNDTLLNKIKTFNFLCFIVKKKRIAMKSDVNKYVWLSS